jgi:hypothetical protein
LPKKVGPQPPKRRRRYINFFRKPIPNPFAVNVVGQGSIPTVTSIGPSMGFGMMPLGGMGLPRRITGAMVPQGIGMLPGTVMPQGLPEKIIPPGGMTIQGLPGIIMPPGSVIL